MAVMFSAMLPLGTIAPDFSLFDPISEKSLTLSELKSDNATVIMFISNHCPFVKHVREELIRLANDYVSKNVSLIAINSNDPATYPDDSPEQMKKVATQYGYPFPYLFDETQQTARDYQAACTPDFFIFDDQLRCVYRGQLDDSRPGNHIPPNGKDLRNALDTLLSGKKIDQNQKPSTGCSIKWRNV